MIDGHTPDDQHLGPPKPWADAQSGRVEQPGDRMLDYLAGLSERIQELEDTNQIPSNENQIILTRRIQSGNADAVRELVRTNRRLIGFVVADCAGSHADEPKPLIEAAQSMIKVAGQYDPYRHGPFAQYAGKAIVGDLQATGFIDSHVVNPESVAYEDELADRFGKLCFRVADELVPVAQRGNPDITGVWLPGDRQSIMISQRTTSKDVDLPGAMVLDGFMASIRLVRRGQEQPDGRPGDNTQQFVLLEDGTLSKVQVVDKATLEDSGLSIHSFDRLPNETYTVVSEEASPQDLEPILQAIEHELGPEIDWENVTIDTVLKASEEVLGLDPAAFRRNSASFRAASDDIAKRGLAFKLITSRKISSFGKLERHTGLARGTIDYSISRADVLLAQDASSAAMDFQEYFSKLIKSLPRKES